MCHQKHQWIELEFLFWHLSVMALDIELWISVFYSPLFRLGNYPTPSSCIVEDRSHAAYKAVAQWPKCCHCWSVQNPCFPRYSVASVFIPGCIFSFLWLCCCCCSVISDSLRPRGLQHTRLPCPSPSPGACSNSRPLSPWCHLTILSSVTPFSSCLPSFSASGSFPVSWLFTSGGKNTGASASASVLPINIQDWFPLGLTGLISLLSKGFSRVFSNTIVQKHQFFGTQPFLWSNPHIHTWLLKKTRALTMWTFFGKVTSAF